MARATLDRKWISAKTLAEALDIQESTIRKWGREGRIPAKIIGGRLMRFDLEGTIRALKLDKD